MTKWTKTYFKSLKGDNYYFKKDIFSNPELNGKLSDYILMILGNTDTERLLSNAIADKFNVNTNVYDKVIDSVYNTTHIGGSSLHHNLDGAHTFDGVIKVLHNHFPNDTDFNLILKGYEHLARDFTTSSGINPFLNPHDFLDTKEILTSQLHLPASRINDLLNLNAIELTATVVAVFSVLFELGKNRTKRLSELAARFSLVSFFSGNPALLFLSLVLFGQSSVRTFKNNEYLNFSEGVFEGGISTASFFIIASLIPGPQFLAILGGLIASVGVDWIFNKSKSFFSKDVDAFLKDLFPYYKSYFKKF